MTLAFRFLSLPLHIARFVRTATLQRRDVVNNWWRAMKIDHLNEVLRVQN